MATTDGGATWQVQVPADPEHGPLTHVSFVDARRGWAVGSGPYRGATMHTTDGGKTWTPVPQAPGYSVDFIDRNTGWIVDRDQVLHTTDGGVTWSATEIASIPDLFLTDVDFVNSSDGWAVGLQNGEQSYVVKTSDGGVTWSLYGIAGVSTVRGVAALPSGTAWVVGVGIFSMD